MGGSGRERGYQRKLTVEECCFIDINEIVRDGLKKQGEVSVFKKTTEPLWKKEVCSVSYTLRSIENIGSILQLEYFFRGDNEAKKILEQLRLLRSRLHSGGKRFWFEWPIIKNEIPCLRRVAKLYLPPWGRFFGCRHCYDLSYKSCQWSHRKDWLACLMAKKMPGTTSDEISLILSRLSRNGYLKDPLIRVED